jgi:hypothetical protein
MTVRLKNLAFSFVAANHMYPKEKMELFLLPTIRIDVVGGLSYHLVISWMTFSAGFAWFVVKKQYRNIFKSNER